MSPKSQTLLLYLTLVAIQAAHSVEEYISNFFVPLSQMSRFTHDLTDFFPVITITGLMFLILNITLLVFFLLLVPFLFQKRYWAMLIAGIIAVVEVLNGLTHIIISIGIGGYFPGSISALGLLVVGILFFKCLGRWYAIDDRALKSK
jgi:hypothetical protein